MSVHNRRHKLQSSFEYLLHFQHRHRTNSFSRKECYRTSDLADHVARESGARDSNECHRAPVCRAHGSDKFENLLESQRPLLQVRSLHHARKVAQSMLEVFWTQKTSISMLVI
jgi:hypothetical protein